MSTRDHTAADLAGLILQYLAANLADEWLTGTEVTVTWPRGREDAKRFRVQADGRTYVIAVTRLAQLSDG